MSKNNSSYNVISEEQLLRYINGKLSGEEQYMVERAIEEDPFLYDALEGLAEIQNKETISQLTAQINANLSKQLQQKPKNKPIKFLQFSWMTALVIVLILAVLAWYILHLSGKG